MHLSAAASMGKPMIRKISLFLLSGLAWLALFSIPVRSGVSVYDLGRYYVIDTRLVRWTTQKAGSALEVGRESASETADRLVRPVEPGFRAVGETLESAGEQFSESMNSLSQPE